MPNIFSAFQFNWYGFLIAAAMVVGIFVAYKLAAMRDYNDNLVFLVAVICIPLAIVGARAYYIIFDIIGGESSASYWTFGRILGFENGKYVGLEGLAIYGGLIGSMCGAVIVYLIIMKKEPSERVSFFQMLDLFFILIILGQAIGRWGNFANDEAHGALVENPSWQWFPYAYTRDGVHWYQATFFYESFCNLIGFGIMLYLYIGKKKSFDGFIFSFYCIWYGIVRAIIEGFRTDSLYLIPGVLRVSQLLSIIIIFVGIAIIVFHIVKAKKSNKKIFIMVPLKNLSEEYYGFDKCYLTKPKREKKVKKNDE